MLLTVLKMPGENLRVVFNSKLYLAIMAVISLKCVSIYMPYPRIKINDLLTTSIVVDPGCKFLISASSNRGWHGDSTRTVFVHEIKNVD